MNVSEEFAELRKQFQRLHTQLDQDMLFLNVCHWPDDKSQAESAAEHCNVPIEILGLMHIPSVHPKNHAFLFEDDPAALFNEAVAASIDKQNRGQAQRYIVGFPESDRRPPRKLKVAYLKCPNETTRQVAHQFRSLAQQAGAALPTSVSDAIPTFIDTTSYIDKWLEFVFWQHPPSLDELLHLNSTRDTFVFSKPCDVSARAIAECGLNTANPAFRPRRGHWPRWAGHLPELQPSDDAATESSAEIAVIAKSSKTEKGPVHATGQEPPSEYRRHKKQDESPLGPITGKMVALGYALHRNKNLTDQGYRDQFHTSVKNETIWARKSESEPGKIEMFIRATSSSKSDADQKKVKHCKKMVNQFESRPKRQKSTSKSKSSKVKQSEPKSNKAT